MIDKISNVLMKSKFFSSKFDKKTILQFIKYLVVGFSSSFIELVLFYSLYKALPSLISDIYTLLIYGQAFVFNHVITLTANTIAYTVVFFYNYTLQRKWAFKSTADVKKQVLQYALLFGFNLFVSNYMVIFFIDILKLHIFGNMQYLVFGFLKINTVIPLLAKVLAIGIVVS